MEVLLILFPIVFIGLLIWFCVALNGFLRKKGVHKYWRLLSYLPLLIFCYLIYVAVFPNREFYEDDFIEVVGEPMPKGSSIKFKEASFPDHFGDYVSVVIVDVGTHFYSSLNSSLVDNGFILNGLKIGSSEFKNAEKYLGDYKIIDFYSKEIDDKYYSVSFLSDQKTIVVHRVSY